MFFLSLWGAIDLLLIIFMFPCMRNAIKEQREGVWQRSLHKTATLMDKIETLTKEGTVWIGISIVLYMLLEYQTDDVLNKIIEFCKGTLVMGFLPSVVSLMYESKNICGKGWHIGCIILGIISSIVGYANYNDKVISCILIAGFISTFIMSFYKIIKQKGKSTLNLRKGLRKDLYNRTSSIDLNVSNTERIRKMESFVSEYLKRYRKIKGLRLIEYVKVLGVYREEWYNRVKRYFIVLMVVTLVFCGVEGMILSQPYFLNSVGLIVFFVITICILKHIDEDYLYKMAIRFWYSEWSYCLYFTDKCRLVGIVQLFQYGKCNRYVYALLDYVAYLRVIYTEDETNKTKNIKLLSKNLSLLYEEYKDVRTSDWINVLPLWILAFYEYLLWEEIGSKTSEVLKLSIKDEDDWKRISIFMQSFVVDLFRRDLNKQDINLVKHFVDKVKISCGTHENI